MLREVVSICRVFQAVMGSLDFIFKCDVKLLEGFKEVNYMILFLFKNSLWPQCGGEIIQTYLRDTGVSGPEPCSEVNVTIK